MIRHGIIQRPATDAQPAAPYSCVSMVIVVAQEATTSCSVGRLQRAAVQRSRLTVSSPVLPIDGRAIADISRKLKSP
jgi:hypothetical protein